MILKGLKEKSKFWFITLTVLISINFWSFQIIPEGVYRGLEALNIFCILLIVIYHSFIFKKKLVYKSSVLFFMLIPVLSAFGALNFHDQPLNLSFLILRIQLYWLFYFILHLFNLSSEKIIKLIVFVGLVWGAITILQQVTYPTYFFYTRSDSDDNSIFRAGVYRFMVRGHQYGVFLLFFFFYKYLINRKEKYILYILFGLVSLYFYGTRQFAVAAIACMFLASLFVKGKARVYAILGLLVAIPTISFFKDELFSQYIEMTKDQLQYGDDIRQLSGNFWLFEYWPNNWTAKLTGNGPAHEESSYGEEMELIRVFFHYYRSDVGIIGVFNEFGIFYVINIIYVNLIGLKNKFYLNKDKYLKILFINSLVLLVLSQYYTQSIGIPFYCLLFYLVDKAFEEKKAEEKMQLIHKTYSNELNKQFSQL
jgi:hypothetical protein